MVSSRIREPLDLVVATRLIFPVPTPDNIVVSGLAMDHRSVLPARMYHHDVRVKETLAGYLLRVEAVVAPKGVRG